MTSRTITRLAGASLIVTTSMVGCSGAQMNQRPALTTNNAATIATGIEKALAGRDFARALLDAERLVEVQPRDAASRTLLGRAYLANGRYASARTALEDAVTLGANDPRTIISLSLVRTAMGNPDSARALLSAHIGDLPASDYGLAMAMSGDVQEGLRALLEAVRVPEADAQTRQNLAYALALSGQWGQARLVAGQDLSGSQLQQRLAQWAQTAQGEAYPQRVAAFLGVQPRGDDSGLPERLALSASEPTSLAVAQPLQPSELAAEAVADARSANNFNTNTLNDGPSPDDQALAAAQPEPVPPAPPADADRTVLASLSADRLSAANLSPERAFPADAPVPVIRASADPMRQAVMQRLAEPVVTPNNKGAGRAQARTAFASPRNLALAPQSVAATGSVHGGSDWVVQIGAYSNGAGAASAWARANGKSLEQRGFRKILGQVTLNGRTYHRLAMSGFATRGAADQLCSGLRAQGQTCFVRHDTGVANAIRMARAGKPAKVAQAAPNLAPKSTSVAASNKSASAKPVSVKSASNAAKFNTGPSNIGKSNTGKASIAQSSITRSSITQSNRAASNSPAAKPDRLASAQPRTPVSANSVLVGNPVKLPTPKPSAKLVGIAIASR
ncbi:SPOR domain-containing protein [Sphingobium sufflavum]|uniref:SPOR domain-containing protein n=1 Tax=Sphingobium sufflavum TaxID=1129547 RepID=UPI001F448789|nr:SPOR domain-containing protein [Sphingobium sufflavum]MCE7798484.1 SPOR domain-containing protein [Sphingobium sufflavum]